MELSIINSIIFYLPYLEFFKQKSTKTVDFFQNCRNLSYTNNQDQGDHREFKTGEHSKIRQDRVI